MEVTQSSQLGAEISSDNIKYFVFHNKIPGDPRNRQGIAQNNKGYIHQPTGNGILSRGKWRTVPLLEPIITMLEVCP